jgi:hypothetical protein
LIDVEKSLLGGASSFTMMSVWRFCCCFNPRLVRVLEDQHHIKQQEKEKQKEKEQLEQQ